MTINFEFQTERTVGKDAVAVGLDQHLDATPFVNRRVRQSRAKADRFVRLWCSTPEFCSFIDGIVPPPPLSAA